MQKDLALLEGCPLFAGVKPGELDAMMGCLDARTAPVARGELLWHAGDEARRFGVVLAGSLHICQEGADGSLSVIGHAGPGELVGEAFAFAGETLPVSVQAAADSRVLLIDSRRLISPCQQACGFHQQLIFNLLRSLARKSLAFRQKIEILSQRTTRDKLLAYLHMQMRQHGPSFVIPYDRQGLADFLAVDRSGLSMEISRLRAEGVLECQKNRFTLLDM